MKPGDQSASLSGLAIPLARDGFLRNIMRGLAGTLEEVIGLEHASGFFANVGQDIGDQIDAMYREALAMPRLDLPRVAQVLVDLKARIGGEFSILELTPERLVLGNTRCPFEDQVVGRNSMCMMTSNVFGAIVAANLGYARVVLEETIAAGHRECRVVIHLAPADGPIEPGAREYYEG